MDIRFDYPSRDSRAALLDLQLSNLGLTRATAERRIEAGAEIAKDMLRVSHEELTGIHDMGREGWIIGYRTNPRLTEWFGAVEKPRHVQRIYQRHKGIRDRFLTGFNVRFRPADDDSPAAQTMGVGNIGRDSMTMFPRGVAQDAWNVAQLLIHEIGHHWFTDQKLEKEKVYGARKARLLAEFNPRKARRSTENYEHYSAAVHEALGMRSKGVNWFDRSAA